MAGNRVNGWNVYKVGKTEFNEEKKGFLEGR